MSKSTSTSWAHESGHWFRCDARRRPLDSERFAELPPADFGDTFSEGDALRLMDQKAVAASDQADGELPLAQRVDAARRALSGAQNAQAVKVRAAEVKRAMGKAMR